MAIIRVKRSGATGSPSALAQGEMAYSFLGGTQSNGGDRLYIGTGTESGGVAANIEVIGGKYFTSMLDHVPGTLTASSALIVDANSKLDNLNIDNININGNVISTTDTNGNLVLSPNGTGVIDAGSKRITNGASPIANSDFVTLGYLNNSYGGAISITSSQVTDFTEAAQDAIASAFAAGTQSGLAITYNDASNSFSFNVNDPTITLSGDVAGSATMTNLGDVTITATIQPNSVALGTDTTGNYVAGVTGGTGVTVTGSAGEGWSPTIAIGQDVSTTANVVFNKIETVDGLIVGGNLIVNGNTVTINTSTLSVEDNMIYLNANSTVTNPDLGFAGNYNDGTYAHAGFFRDATDGRWKVFKGYTLEPDASPYIDTSHASFALADMQAATFYGALSGNATTATTLQTARTITLGGLLSGSASFNGSADITITGSVADATTSTKGIASFSSSNFTVTSGAVSISAIDGGTY